MLGSPSNIGDDMLIVEVKLYSAVTGKVTVLGRCAITNIGGTQELGDYYVRTYRKGSKLESLDKLVPVRQSYVNNHRRRKEHVWKLVRKALSAMGY